MRVARSMTDADPGLAAPSPVGPGVRAGVGPGPNLLIEDHHWIRLFALRGNQLYSYRALLLARAGDMAAIGEARSPTFERYCADTLRLGAAEILQPAPGRVKDSLAARCVRDAAMTDHIARRARREGGLNIIPYMGTAGVWGLAAALAARSGVPVHVAAPVPGLVRRANDKLWFTDCVNRLVGNQAVPRTWSVFGSAMLAARVAALARSSASVVVKLPDSASSKGNFVLESASLSALSVAELRRRLIALMRRAGWRNEFPVLVSAWEGPVLVSPSVHLWIPGADEGDPLVEAVFDQRVIGRSGVFCGAVPSTLPSCWRQRVAREAALLGLLFQSLGYVGRCSFDAIVVGTAFDRATLHWIECNGRWGGVSVPMTLAARLFGDWHRSPFVIVERADLGYSPRRLEPLLRALGPELYVAGGPPAGAVILSPSPLEAGTGYELMVFDEDVPGALERARRIDARIEDVLAGAP